METRILIPNGLQLIVTDSEAKSGNESSKLSKANIIKSEDDSEEKPSSSSGHCETPEDDQNHFQPKSRKCKEKRDSSTCEEDNGLWKKEQKSRFTTFSSSTSSTSTMSPATLDSSSSSSDNEVDVDYFVKARQKSENAIIGSTRNSLECKKSPSSTRKQECDDDDDKMNASGDKNLNNYQNQVKICATRVIEKGTVFTPNDGDIQVAHLKGIQPIPKDDVRFIFGCFETFTQGQPSSRISSSPVSDPRFSPASTTAASPPPTSDTGDQSGNNCNFVRLCNWIRFLRRNSSLRNIFNTIPQQPKKLSKSEDHVNWNNDRKTDSHKKRNIFQTGDTNESDWPNSINDLSKKSFLTTTNTPGGTSDKSHNMIARFEEGRPMFEVTERLVPGTELVAHFDMNSVFKSTSSISPYMTMMMSTLPSMLAKTAEATTPSSPPAPTSSSTLISSSSPPPPPGLLSFGGTKTGTGNVGLGVKKERDEKELLQHHHQRLIMPAYPYSFYDNYAALENKALFTNNTSTFNAFRFGEGNNAQFGKEGKRTNAGIKQDFSGALGIADGPLDLSKFPAFNKSHLESFNEPLKIGTPFDSPDSNDDDPTKRIPSTSVKCEEENSSMFSIKNVLKPKSVAPCKLFQPYSLEIGKKSPEKDAFMRALISSNPSSASNALGTAPRSEFPLTGRNAGGLRPILRTRGRERSLLPCEVCGKAFDRPSLLKRHLRTHTGEKPHICDVCSKGFSTSSSLNTHRRIHSGEKPHQCPICGKRFTASSNLYYHRMTHNKEKPHKCMLCGKSFPTPGDLKSHQYVHSGSWPYTCHVCHRGFSKQTNLRNHLLLHSGMTNNTASNKPGDKPHTCQVCGQKFAQACNLRAHVKTHEESDSSSSTLTSSCSVCKRTFLPTSEMLLNGRCRNCQLRIPNSKSSCSDHNIRRDSISTSPVPNPCINSLAVGKAKEGFIPSYDNHTATATSLLSQRFLAQGNASQQQLASSISSLNLPLSQFPGLSLPGLTNALAFPTNVAPLHFSLNVNPTASNPTDLLSSAGTQSTTRNTLFDTLVEWNYRMAKESVGLGSLSLGLMQQKLLESQSRMIASQFINTHGFGMGGGIQDILGLRPAMNPEGFSALDPVVSSESKYLQR